MSTIRTPTTTTSKHLVESFSTQKRNTYFALSFVRCPLHRKQIKRRKKLDCRYQISWTKNQNCKVFSSPSFQSFKHFKYFLLITLISEIFKYVNPGGKSWLEIPLILRLCQYFNTGFANTLSFLFLHLNPSLLAVVYSSRGKNYDRQNLNGS